MVRVQHFAGTCILRKVWITFDDVITLAIAAICRNKNVQCALDIVKLMSIFNHTQQIVFHFQLKTFLWKCVRVCTSARFYVITAARSYERFSILVTSNGTQVFFLPFFCFISSVFLHLIHSHNKFYGFELVSNRWMPF